MAVSPAPQETPSHFRSISMPSGGHPTALKVEDKLHELRACTASTSSSTSSKICSGLRVLGELYDSIDDLLQLPSVQQAFFHPNQRRWLENEMDRSVELLDICNTLKDELTMAEANLQHQESAHQERVNHGKHKPCNSICQDKKTQKIVKKIQKTLKHMEKECRSWPLITEDPELLMVARVQNEGKEITVSLLLLVLSHLSKSMLKPRSNKWLSVLKVMDRSKVSPEETNEDKCEPINMSFKDIEIGLECLFRRQIKNRVYLLNIISL